MPELTFGERVERLEREFRARGKTQADLAESLNVSPRTVQRWKGRTDPPGRGSKVFQEIGGKTENVLRRRERYYYRYAPKEEKPLSPTPEIQRRGPQLTDVDLGDLADPVFVFPGGPRQALARAPDLGDAVRRGGEITVHLRGTRLDRSAEEDTLITRTIHLPKRDPQGAEFSFESHVFRFVREIFGIEGGSDVTLTIVGASWEPGG